ncbi:hypothetical protein CJ030_MR1G014049 [Morella rubra]|uniref:Uncharacterized protein n=1 Tax=Morella rubra TaxID=262757 RepID=A0A6A1WRQ6_9ROSI|nr:hypothetical protein CJ030_MR1G014049 [Morella rubra]
MAESRSIEIIIVLAHNSYPQQIYKGSKLSRASSLSQLADPMPTKEVFQINLWFTPDIFINPPTNKICCIHSMLMMHLIFAYDIDPGTTLQSAWLIGKYDADGHLTAASREPWRLSFRDLIL